ncbi:MAG TPA: hypothetical protein VMD05_07395 [Candidatus Nanoarchaeia archaeon]|nr:hypothetical protein [Candidatus Nanoarchaeia archaeon]
MSRNLDKQSFRVTRYLVVTMKGRIVLVFILALTASSLIMVNPKHTSAQNPTPTPTHTPFPTPPTNPNQTSSPTPTPAPPQITLSSTSILTPPQTSTPPLTPTSIPNSTPIFPKPLVPEFAVKLIVLPPEVNKTIELTIKNQPFVSYFDGDSGWNISLYYDVRVRVNGGNWSIIYLTEDVKVQSNSESTVLLYPSDGPGSEYQYFLGDKLLDLFLGDQVDFQVEAMIGYIHRVLQGSFAPYYFVGETSDWSNTQTIIISTSNSSSTPNQSPSPSLSIAPRISPTPSPSLSPTPTVNPIIKPLESPTEQPIISPNATNGPAPVSPFISLIVFFFAVLAVIMGILVYFGKKRR